MHRAARSYSARAGCTQVAGLPAPLFILDQGYSASGLTRTLADMPVQLLVRIAGDRVFHDGRPEPRAPSPESRAPAATPHRALWIWHADPTGTLSDLDVLRRAYLRRFDTEHTFGLLKSELGRTAARLRTPEQTQRWTWIVLAAYARLRLARHLVADLRRPWKKPPRPGRGLSPHRVRRGCRHLHDRLDTRVICRKPARPEPGVHPAGRTLQLSDTPSSPRRSERTPARSKGARRGDEPQAWK